MDVPEPTRRQQARDAIARDAHIAPAGATLTVQLHIPPDGSVARAVGLMGRRATGSIVEHETKDGRVTRSLRFPAYGERQFVALGEVSRDHAERELRGILADVERGIWQPHEPPPAPEPEPEPEPEPVTFHAFAEQWWIERELEPATKT